MLIRPFQPGDETQRVRIFNAAAEALPAFKPATLDEVIRRSRTIDLDPQSQWYATDGDQVVGYAVFNPNGRVSYPWCLPGFDAAKGPLLRAITEALKGRGVFQAWAAYRADWLPIHDFFREHGFQKIREMVNYVAETSALPSTPLPSDMTVGPFHRDALPRFIELCGDLVADDRVERLGKFFWENPFFGGDSLFALRAAHGTGPIVAAALVVADHRFADPTKLDAAMPCFRLGAFGTEEERHKRVNGMVSCVFKDPAAGTVLLAEAARRLQAAGLAHAAAQAPSDRPDLLAFYDRFFQRQGSFPILSRKLD